jgi:hypothetical protein
MPVPFIALPSHKSLLVQVLTKPAEDPGGRPAHDHLQMVKLQVDEKILPALHWAAVESGDDRPDQPDLQPGPFRTDCSVEMPATERRLKAKLAT